MQIYTKDKGFTISLHSLEFRDPREKDYLLEKLKEGEICSIHLSDTENTEGYSSLEVNIFGSIVLGICLVRSINRTNAVEHPSHYGGKDDPYEVIKVIEAWGLGFTLGNTVKYIARVGKKDPDKILEDLKKARWYLDREIEKYKENE